MTDTPNPYKLPARCYCDLPGYPGKVVMVRFGEIGYWPTSMSPKGADEMNAARGVTPAIREAMQVGSMFGWNVPGTNPAHYDKARPLAEVMADAT